ncbi:dopa 4,5-dioxygenase family domain-containing protein [Ditylenchus destructor]|nr:dopa 4,5-dioxygenase family domain-containing protein [Ditylenchus destructor]
MTDAAKDALVDPSAITGWHFHVYFDAESKEKAWILRELVEQHLKDKLTELGRFHEKPVGPHPKWSYMLAVAPKNLQYVFEWMVLNHGDLDVLIHPETGNDLRDHKVSATWIGSSHKIDYEKL